MSVFIVALPLFDSNMTVRAYRLCDQSGERTLSVKNDFRGKSEAFVNPGLDLVEKVGIAPFAADMPLFVEISRLQLMMGIPTNTKLPPQQLVCAIPGGLPVDNDLLEKCKALKALGFSIALDDFPLSGMQSPYFEYADYLMLNYNNMRFPEIFKAVTHNLPELQLVISNIPDMATFESMGRDKESRKAYFSGQFYSQPITRGSHDIAPIKVNALQLLRNVNQEDFDLGEIVKIIERDPALTIALLKFINSGALGLNRKVESIQSAVAILGQQEVKRWATITISVELAQDRPGEITKLSLVRAKFAENLAGAFELGIFQSSLFISGLFSLLDVILQKPMAEAIKEVAVDKRVQDALVDRTGELYKVMELIYAYERADWDQVSILMIRNNIDITQVSGAFVNALVWYDLLLKAIDEE